jgi:hypothetical protein
MATTKLKKYRVTAKATVYYDEEVYAASKEEALAKLDNGELEPYDEDYKNRFDKQVEEIEED